MNFPSTGILDNFNRADEGPPPSASWSAWVSPGLQVVSNQMAPNDNGDNAASYNPTFGPDQEVYWTLATKAAVSGTYNTLALRTDPTTNDGYQVEHFNQTDTVTETLYLQKIVSTVYTQLGASVSQILSSGDSFGARAIGTTLEIWYKASGGSWTLLASRTDSAFSGASPNNQLAAYTYGALSTTTQRFEDFGGGNVVSYLMFKHGTAGLRPRPFAPGLAR